MKITPRQLREIVILTIAGKTEERDAFISELRKRFEDSQKYLNQKKNKTE
jgi:hypothetical protein